MKAVNQSAVRVRGVIVTVVGGGGGPDFLSRYFAPWVGIDEDPVTGSAHTVLAPFWAAQAGFPAAGGPGQRPMWARQVSARTGDLWLRIVDGGAGKPKRVRITGKACCVLRGEMNVA